MSGATSGPAGEPVELLTSLLREVSRSFYLTLRILPSPVRTQIGVAYLLARATDTIADTDAVPAPERLGALELLRRRIVTGPGASAPDLRGLAGRQVLAGERALLERINEALVFLENLAPADQQRVRDVLNVIVGGQALDLQRFEPARVNRTVTALASAEELDDYTYRVAGCVGEFWTRMCVAHLFPTPDDPLDPHSPASWFESAGVRFGKGLQLVNILRDLPRDLRQGRCYLPQDALVRVRLTPADLLEPSNEGRMRPVYDEWLQRASGHLENGWRYTCALPSGAIRLRLACAWPVLIGARTLAALANGPVLDPERRMKVSRAEVRRIMRRTICTLPFRRRWQALYRSEAAAR